MSVMKKLFYSFLLLSASISPVFAKPETKVAIVYPTGGVDRKCTWTQKSIADATQEALEQEGFSTEVIIIRSADIWTPDQAPDADAFVYFRYASTGAQNGNFYYCAMSLVILGGETTDIESLVPKTLNTYLFTTNYQRRYNRAARDEITSFALKVARSIQ